MSIENGQMPTFAHHGAISIRHFIFSISSTCLSHPSSNCSCRFHNHTSSAFPHSHPTSRISTNSSSSPRNKLTIWTSIMRFPSVIVTTKFPAIIKLNALLRALRLHRPADIIKLLPIDADRRLKHRDLVRRPSL